MFAFNFEGDEPSAKRAKDGADDTAQPSEDVVAENEARCLAATLPATAVRRVQRHFVERLVFGGAALQGYNERGVQIALEEVYPTQKDDGQGKAQDNGGTLRDMTRAGDARRERV